jgi:hypothetical protein
MALSYTGNALVLTYGTDQETRQIRKPLIQTDGFITVTINFTYEAGFVRGEPCWVFRGGLALSDEGTPDLGEELVLVKPISGAGAFRFGAGKIQTAASAPDSETSSVTTTNVETTNVTTTNGETTNVETTKVVAILDEFTVQIAEAPATRQVEDIETPEAPPESDIPAEEADDREFVFITDETETESINS